MPARATVSPYRLVSPPASIIKELTWRLGLLVN
jgi:hypothetical protein